MKLIIQIPCYNEADSLPTMLAQLPRHVEGFDTVEWMVIDDGSTDNTGETAKNHGVNHVVSHLHNQGLAQGFMTGLDTCLDLGADVIINTDADNQYNAEDIPALVAPIIERRAEIVIGARPIEAIEHFTPIKKMLQKLGSWVVRVTSKTMIPDAPSGFRAMTRTAAQRLVVFSDYTYTLETIIQAGRNNIAITSVPVRVNDVVRPSRLVKSIPSYIKHSIITIVRIFVIYSPFRFFGTIGAILLFMGFLIGLRFLWYFFIGEGDGHIQSVILSGVLLGIGFQTILIAFVADLLAANRKLLEKLRYQVNVYTNPKTSQESVASETER